MLAIPKCMECKNFIDDGAFGCKAFKEIPKTIFFNKEDHNSVKSKQIGSYIYEPIGDVIENND